MKSSWSAADIPDQSMRVFVITGANSGLGKEAARELVRSGAYVVMACRDVAKAEAAKEEILQVSGGHREAGGAEVRHLDVSDLDSVRAFAAGLAGWRIDVLINNAGIMNVPFARTAQGFESQFGTNVLGHFLLTSLLLDQISDRVVWVSSMVHKMGTIDLSDLNFERRKYTGWAAYAQSKLADLMLAYELQRRLTGAGSTKRSVAAHPGYSATNLQSHSGTWLDTIMSWANTVPQVAQPASAGALPVLYAATVPDLPGGSFIGPDGFMEMQGAPRTVGSSAASHDVDTARRLWAACEQLTGAN